MGTKLTELRDGCFHAALDDEPMFVLLARDPDAPRVIRNWAAARTEDIERGRRPASDASKVVEARRCADQMEKWRAANDGAWRDGLYAEPERPRHHGTHSVRQENDEYACSCGYRWDVHEGEEHP